MKIDSKLVFGADVIQKAYEEIRLRELDSIYCSLTGVEFGHVSEDEIKGLLRIELDNSPLATADYLIDRVQMRQFLWSQKPAPTFQFHRDHKTLVRILRADDRGPAKLFSYLAGRFFFESLVNERHVDSSLLREAKFYFLTEFYQRVKKLPEDWHQSLTADDELAQGAESTIHLINQMVKMEPTPEGEAKAAQRSLEILLRLDAIYNLRTKFYDHVLKRRFEEFRESLHWNFAQLHQLLSELEETAIIRLSERKAKPEGNAMAIPAAMESFTWSAKRIEALRRRLERMEEDRAINSSSSATHILHSIHKTLTDAEIRGKLTKRELRQLESAEKSLHENINSLKYSDKRLDSLRRLYSNTGRSKETTVSIRGVKTLKHLAEALLDSGKPVPKELKQKIDKAIESGQIKSKPKTKPKKGKPGRIKINTDMSQLLGSLKLDKKG